jgi:hypothetical protein
MPRITKSTKAGLARTRVNLAAGNTAINRSGANRYLSTAKSGTKRSRDTGPGGAPRTKKRAGSAGELGSRGSRVRGATRRRV